MRATYSRETSRPRQRLRLIVGMLYRRMSIRQVQQVIRPQSANRVFLLVSLLDLPVISVQNTIVGPGVSLCCKRLSTLVHTKPFL